MKDEKVRKLKPLQWFVDNGFDHRNGQLNKGPLRLNHEMIAKLGKKVSVWPGRSNSGRYDCTDGMWWYCDNWFEDYILIENELFEL